MNSPVYFDFDKEMQQVALFLQLRSDMVADSIDLKIKEMMAKGMGEDAIISALRRDLYSGGPIFSGFTSTFKSAVFPSIDTIAQGPIYQDNPDEDQWEWVTTSVEPCPDCEPRHGEVKTYAEWEAEGLPRSGFSVCGDHCKCVLVPAGKTGKTIKDGPVKVTTLAQKRADFQERLSSDSGLKSRMENYRASARGAESN